MTKPIIVVGKPGTGRTFKARAFAAGPYVEFYANDIFIDDVYSFPKDVAIIIEDVHYKPDKNKILDLIYAKRKVILTSIDKKSVPKAIINACDVKLSGSKSYTQMKMQMIAPNRDEIKVIEDNIWSMANAYMRMRDRDEFLRGMQILKPAPMQILSWAAKNNPSNKLAAVASTMHRWPVEYFYALLAYSHEGKYKTIQPPQRKSDNPFPDICIKLGLREEDGYLVRSMIKNPDYAKWAASKLTEAECKVLRITKEKKAKPSKVKATKKTLEDFL